MTRTTLPGRALGSLWRALPVISVASLGFGVLAAGIALRSGETILGGASVIGQAAMLLFRERLPRTTLVVVAILDLVGVAFTRGETNVGMVGMVIAVYALSRRVEGRSMYLWLAGTALVSTIVCTIALGLSLSGLQAWAIPVAILRALIVFALPLLTAEVANSRARLLTALQDRAELADRERDYKAAEAVATERSLIARELHDIAAHHLSGIIVGAQAAGALSMSNPGEARDYMRQVTHDAQLTLKNLRLTVGLMRTEGPGDRAPLPSIHHIAELINDLRGRGREIEFHESGVPAVIGPIAETSAYRMVQESLANARSHAPGAVCKVIIQHSVGGTQLTVTNDPPSIRPLPSSKGSGYGLIGMEERAALLNARLAHGPLDNGGWRNDLFIPAVELPAAQPVAGGL